MCLWGNFLYLYTMLYAKMFHGYDILKHFKTWGLTPKMPTLGIAQANILSLMTKNNYQKNDNKNRYAQGDREKLGTTV